MEYIIYSDESDREGKYFGNFYGAVLVRSTDVNHVERSLRKLKESININGEIKWTKVPANDGYLEKYMKIMDCFFDFVKRDIVKVRIMFKQNIHVAQNLTKEQKDNEFLLLYYQFLKHSFGLKYCDEVLSDEKIKLKFYFDDLPIPEIDAKQFKDYIYRLDTTKAYGNTFCINYDDMAEVNSKNHVILQCLDVILGGVCAKLNNKFSEVPEGQRRRSKQARYKEKLYKQMLRHIQEMLPGFNAGTSTGLRGPEENFWKHSYRHWLFVPKDFKIDPDPNKRKRK